MRPSITVLLVLVIGSMLVGTAFAECVAMNMPCCARHAGVNCHEVCAPPTGNVNSATLPQTGADSPAVLIVRPILPVTRVVTGHIPLPGVPSAENLLMRLHVLLI